MSNLEDSLKKISDLYALFVQRVKNRNAMDFYDINLVSEDFLVELLREVYDYHDLVNLNVEGGNYAGIDLGDKNQRVAFQVTSTAKSNKIEKTLNKFVEHKLYEQYDHLIVLIITEKQKSYAGKRWPAIISSKFRFKKEEDIWDYRDLLKAIRHLPSLDKVQKVEVIFERHFGSPDQMSAEQTAVDEGAALQRYLSWVVEQYSVMQVLDMDRSRSMSSIYTAVKLLDEPEAARYVDLDSVTKQQSRRSSQSKEDRIDGLELVRHEKRIFLLGSPGAGKTTFLKYLAVQAAKGDERVPFIPIFVSLDSLASSGLELFDFIIEEFAYGGFPVAAPFLQRQLVTGRILLLLDGLDEVVAADKQRDAIIRMIENYARHSRRAASRIVLTSRTHVTQHKFQGFMEAQIADFDGDQVDRFIKGWFREDEEKREALFATLKKPANQGIRDLTKTPLLLTLLCSAFDNRRKFPERRADVYKEAFDVLLDRWDDERSIERDGFYQELSAGRKQEMLARIAYETFVDGEYLITRERLEELIIDYVSEMRDAPERIDIPGREIVRAIVAQHGLLTPRARGIYSFSHLTFQEYLAASYIVDNVDEGALEVLMSHVTEDTWREVFLLTASLLKNAHFYFSQFHLALQKLIENDGSIKSLLQSANIGTGYASLSSYSPAAIRCYYIYLALNLDGLRNTARGWELERLIESVDYEFDSSLYQIIDLDLERTIDLAIAIGRAMDHAIALARPLDRNLNIALTRSLALIRSLEGSLDGIRAAQSVRGFLDLYLDHAQDLNLDIALLLFLRILTAIEHVHDAVLFDSLSRLNSVLVAMTEQLRLVNLSAILTGQTWPMVEAPAEQWQQFAADFKEVLQEQRPIGLPWRFYVEKIRSLVTYLSWSKLLIDCLQVASVKDRKAIENRLLLPPGD